MLTKKLNILREQAEDEIERVYKRHSVYVLYELRRAVSKYNTSRHKITLLCAMGSCSIMVDDRHLHDWPTHVPSKILALLQEIEDNLDWNVGAYLDGKQLN